MQAMCKMAAEILRFGRAMRENQERRAKKMIAENIQEMQPRAPFILVDIHTILEYFLLGF